MAGSAPTGEYRPGRYVYMDELTPTANDWGTWGGWYPSDETKAGKTPHRCPVCEGRGTVPPDFYNQAGSTITDATVQTCKSCANGVVWR